jgi:hypothetical protein
VQVNITRMIDEVQCYQTVRELRWPDGVACPSCASQHVIRRGFDDVESARQRYECHDCDQRFDDLTDTIFAGALVGFQGRGFAEGVSLDFCRSLLLESLLFQWPAQGVTIRGRDTSIRPRNPIRALDAIFFHRVPILMAVEPHSMAWVAGQRGPDRSGESWCQVLANWPWVTRVVTDAGKGLERGVKLAKEARRTAAEGQEEVSVLPLQMGLDVFHTQRELQRVVHGKWKRAERQ